MSDRIPDHEARDLVARMIRRGLVLMPKFETTESALQAQENVEKYQRKKAEAEPVDGMDESAADVGERVFCRYCGRTGGGHQPKCTRPNK